MFGSSSRPRNLPIVAPKRVVVARCSSQSGTSTTSDTSSLSTAPDHNNSGTCTLDSPTGRRNLHSQGLRYKREQAFIKRQLLERAFGALHSSGTTATTESSGDTTPPVSNVYPMSTAEMAKNFGRPSVSRSEQTRLQEENERLRNQLASMKSSLEQVDKEVVSLRLEKEDHARQKDAALAQVADLAVRLANSLSEVNEVHDQLREERATAREYRDKYEELFIQNKRLQAAQRMQRSKRRNSLENYQQDSSCNLYGSSSRLSTSLHNTVTTTTTTTPSPHSSIPRDLNCSVLEESQSALDDSVKLPIPEEVGGDEVSACSTLSGDDDWRHRSLMSMKTWEGNQSDMAVIKNMVEI